MSLTKNDFWSFPKIDLHRHIDGSVPAHLVRRLALQQGLREYVLRDNTIVSVTDKSAFEKFYRIRRGDDIESILARFDFVLSVMQTPEGIEEVFYECMLDCAVQNIWYVEWTFAPAYHTRCGLSYREIFESALRGIERGWHETGVMAKLLPVIQREAIDGKKTEDARDPLGLDIARIAVQHQDRGVAGLGLACNEYDYPPELYCKAFQLTFLSRLGRMPHAGEMGVQREKNICTAIDVLGATRIGHGIPIGSNPTLRALIRERGVAVEANPLSNLITGCISSISELQLDVLLKEGILVSINSDDPALFGKDLTDNFYEVFRMYDWGEKEFIKFTLNALTAAALTTDTERASLFTTFLRKSICYDATRH